MLCGGIVVLVVVCGDGGFLQTRCGCVCVGGRRDKGRGVGQVLANKSSHCAPYPQRMVKGIRTLDLLDNRGIQLPTRVV